VDAGSNCDTADADYGNRTALALRTWHRILVHVRWSETSDGRFEMFLDGSSTPFSSISGRNILDTVNPEGPAADWNYLKMGVYVGGELGEQSPRVFIDLVKLGTSRAEVEGGSPPPAPPSPPVPFPPVPVFEPVSNLQAGDILNGTVTWRVEAPEGAQSVEFWADDERLHVDSAAPFEFALDTRTMTNGRHELGLAWTDAAGERRTPQVGAVTVENAQSNQGESPPPPKPVSNLEAGDTLSGVVQWTVEVPAGAQSVEFWADDERLYIDSGEPFEFALDTRTMTDGRHELGLAWTDASGSRHTPQIGTVTIANASSETD
jgi:hypothetical protein